MLCPKVRRVAVALLLFKLQSRKRLLRDCASWIQLDGLSVHIPARVPYPSLDIWPLSFICQLNNQPHLGSCLSLSIRCDCDCDCVIICGNQTDFRKWLTTPFFLILRSHYGRLCPRVSHQMATLFFFNFNFILWCNSPLLF